MRLRGLIAVAVACACTYACARKQPPQQPLLRNARAMERPPPDAAPPAVATCEDVGAAVNGMDGRYDADTVARECEAAAWPESVRTCLATDAADCLAELSEEQRFQWMGVVESAATVGQPASCDLINVEYVEPVVAEDAPELQWLHAARTHVVIRECRRGWPAELRDCLANT